MLENETILYQIICCWTSERYYNGVNFRTLCWNIKIRKKHFARHIMYFKVQNSGWMWLSWILGPSPNCCDDLDLLSNLNLGRRLQIVMYFIIFFCICSDFTKWRLKKLHLYYKHAKNGIWIITGGTRKITVCSSNYSNVTSNYSNSVFCVKG